MDDKTYYEKLTDLLRQINEQQQIETESTIQLNIEMGKITKAISIMNKRMTAIVWTLGCFFVFWIILLFLTK